MKLITVATCISALMLLGCATTTPSGPYRMMAYNAKGEKLPENFQYPGSKVVFEEAPLIAQDTSAIAKVKSYLCEQYPDAIIKIINFQTQEELVSDSPRKCP